MPSTGCSSPCTRITGGLPGGEVEVRAALLEHLLEQVVDVDALDLVLDRVRVALDRWWSSAGTAGPNTESMACWIS